MLSSNLSILCGGPIARLHKRKPSEAQGHPDLPVAWEQDMLFHPFVFSLELLPLSLEKRMLLFSPAYAVLYCAHLPGYGDPAE